MTSKPIYVYTESGATVYTPDEPASYTRTTTRLIADDGMELTNGITVTSCIDTDDLAAWTEREKTETEPII